MHEPTASADAVIVQRSSERALTAALESGFGNRWRPVREVPDRKDFDEAQAIVLFACEGSRTRDFFDRPAEEGDPKLGRLGLKLKSFLLNHFVQLQADKTS